MDPWSTYTAKKKTKIFEKRIARQLVRSNPSPVPSNSLMERSLLLQGIARFLQTSRTLRGLRKSIIQLQRRLDGLPPTREPIYYITSRSQVSFLMYLHATLPASRYACLERAPRPRRRQRNTGQKYRSISEAKSEDVWLKRE